MDYTEDKVSEKAGQELGFGELRDNTDFYGVGQLTTFNTIDSRRFKGVLDKPDGWYLPNNPNDVAVIFEFKSSGRDICSESVTSELIKNVEIVNSRGLNRVIGVLYNGEKSRLFKNTIFFREEVGELKNIEYYKHLYDENNIDKQMIYRVTKTINDTLHFDFGIKDLYHRMIFTACALVANRRGATLQEGMNYSTFQASISSTLKASLEKSNQVNIKLGLLLDVYNEIRMNTTENQEAIDKFIQCISQIAKCLDSQYWNGEDVMGIFFNEFNRYKKKSESGQIFTPDHITSFMYRLLGCSCKDIILDATCGSGAFLVKAMCNMLNEIGGQYNIQEVNDIKTTHLYGIEFDRQIFALACANMLIHKDGKTNLAHMDARTDEAGRWIKNKPITKVLMNPPYEKKYGCLKIVKNVLNNVKNETKCAFILPDKKLEKNKEGRNLLERHTLMTIIKLPENLFNAGVTTSIFVFNAGVPQGSRKIVGYYIKDDGLETVKNQGRQDIRNLWPKIEDYWINAIQTGEEEKYKTKQIIDPNNYLSYQIPDKPFAIRDEDFMKTVLDYDLFKHKIYLKDFYDQVMNKVLYDSDIEEDGNEVLVKIKKGTKDGNY